MSNIFETLNGVLPIAPTKISGKYKVVVDLDNNLYLDDFLGRKVQIDINNKFLPQVANFLSTSTIEPEPEYLKYGCNHNNKQKTFLVPLYLGDKSKSPKYFSINDNLKNVVCFKDLNNIGLTKIFQEIQEMFQYPITLDFDDSKLNIIGYSIVDLCKKPYSFNINEILANQNKLENVNNTILNSFIRGGLFYPKFINIEFLFETNETSNNFDFQEFTGYLSDEKIISETEFNEDKINMSIGNQTKQVFYYNTYKYDKFIGTSTITNIANQEPSVRFRMKTLSVGDEVKINIDDVLDFSYVCKESDLRGTFYETVIRFCNSATKASNKQYVFSVAERSNSYIEINIMSNSDTEDVELIIPNKFQYINNQKTFKSITDYDFEVYNLNELSVDKIKISGQEFIVTETFVFDDRTYIRLNKIPNIQQGENKHIFLYDLTSSYIIELNPIKYLTVDSNLKVDYQFNPTKYVEELREKFNNRTDTDIDDFNEKQIRTLEVIDDFANKITYFDKYPYTIDIENNDVNNTKSTIETNEVQQTYPLDDIVLKMMFASLGQNSYIAPNILNFDKRFWQSSLCVNPLKLDNDHLKYNWFLIKSVTPKYLQDTNEGLRYFTDEPKITSRVINFTGTRYCETLFLGVKYILPVRYSDYNFAVYLNTETTFELDYKFEINHVKKTIYLVINKFIDFIDLVKGGNPNNEPLIDLSLLYNVQNSYNKYSDALYSFKTGGILFCDNEIPVMFEGKKQTSWRFYEAQTNKWYICLKRSRSVVTDKFSNIFPTSGDSEFYVYSTMKQDNEEVNYISLKIKVVNIRLLTDDYLWCEDLNVEFFETNKMFVVDNDSKVYKVTNDEILMNTPKSGKIYSNFESNLRTTISTDSGNVIFNIINPEKIISFKKDYFEITKNIEYQRNGSKEITTKHFTFPENMYVDYYGTTDIFNKLMTQFESGDTFDNTSYSVTVSLFERNQIWNLIRELINIDIRFKHTLESQTRRIMNNLLVSNLIERANLSTIPSNIEDEYVELIINQLDYNLVVWKDYVSSNGTPKINQIYRHRGIYLPYLVETKSFENSTVLNNNKDILIQIDWVKQLNYKDLVSNHTTGMDAEKLLNLYYKIKYITNEFGQRLDYFIDSDNQFIISFNDLETYHTRFSKLYLTFERK